MYIRRVTNPPTWLDFEIHVGPYAARVSFLRDRSFGSSDRKLFPNGHPYWSGWHRTKDGFSVALLPCCMTETEYREHRGKPFKLRPY